MNRDPSTQTPYTLTVLTAMEGILAKTITQTKKPAPIIKSYDRASRFLARFEIVNNIHELAELMLTLAGDSKSAVILGDLREDSLPHRYVNRRMNPDPKRPEVRPSVIPSPDGKFAVPFDVEKIRMPQSPAVEVVNGKVVGINDPEAAVKSVVAAVLPEYFQGVTFFYSFTSSAGIHGWDEVRLRLWYFADEPIKSHVLGNWAKGIKGLDASIYTPNHPIYTATPVFVNMPDPCEDWRHGLIVGARDTVTIPAAELEPTEKSPARPPQATESAPDEYIRSLKNSLENPPADFPRHESAIAVINMFEDYNRKAEGVAFVQSLHKAWRLDRATPEEWAREVEGWANAAPHPQGHRRGYTFLTDAGFDLPDRPRPVAENEIVVNRHVRDVGEDLIEGLKRLEYEGNPLVYQRAGGVLVELRPQEMKLQDVTRNQPLKALLHERFLPVREVHGKDGVPIRTPSSFSDNHVGYVQRGSDTFQNITAVHALPVFLPDGTLLSEPGYHPDYGVFLDTKDLQVQHMPMVEARDVYLSAFNEFSYQAPRAGFTVTLAFILQAFLMLLIDDLTPMYAILGARRSGSGSGKGYLVDCIYRIHTGRPYTHDGAMPATGEELAKLLFAALLEGSTHIIFDDIDKLTYRELMAAMTSRMYKGRILGVSERKEVSTQVIWAVTGNAPDPIHRDFYRRLLPIFMSAGEKAWQKQYSNPNLHRDILANRSKYVSAAISIITHWREQGMPLSSNTIKGFDRWSAVMGGILETAGFPDLLSARDGLDELIEVDNTDIDLLLSAWADGAECDTLGKRSGPGTKLKGREVLYIAQRKELFAEMLSEKPEAEAAAALTRFLKPYVNDIFGGHYFRREYDSHSKTWTYFLEPEADNHVALVDVFQFNQSQTGEEVPRSTPANDAAGDARGTINQVCQTDGGADEVIEL